MTECPECRQHPIRCSCHHGLHLPRHKEAVVLIPVTSRNPELAREVQAMTKQVLADKLTGHTAHTIEEALVLAEKYGTCTLVRDGKPRGSISIPRPSAEELEAESWQARALAAEAALKEMEGKLAASVALHAGDAAKDALLICRARDRSIALKRRISIMRDALASIKGITASRELSDKVNGIYIIAHESLAAADAVKEPT